MAAPYWVYSDERVSSWLILALNIGVMILSNFAGLRMTAWNRDWLNAFNNRDSRMWVQNIWVFLVIGGIMMLTSNFNVYVTSWINIRWRRWMTARYMRLWMEGGNHYRMQLTATDTDNPDQRISEDISSFIGSTWMYTFSFAQNLLSLGTYLLLLWQMSATIPLILGGKDWSFPGYFIVLAIVWAIITTFIVHSVGKPLSRLNYNQLMYDANFRFALVRFRENSEQIALLKGEDVEHMRIMGIFGDAVVNQFRVMARTLKLGLVNGGGGTTGILNYVDAMMFTLLLGPAFFFYNAIDGYGTLMQIATAFQNVVNGFKWFQTWYAGLASYVAVTDRLYAFNRNYERMLDAVEKSKLKYYETDDDQIVIKHLDVYLPTGKKQISAENLVLKAGEKILIKGRTGAGKTTLFRVLAGIWPYGEGEIYLPKNKRVIVLPQKPYFPIGTLEEAISYPLPPHTYPREEIQKALITVGMEEFVNRLDEVGHWNMLLSGGEQQRVGIARAILFNPDYLFFDEATASMDEPSEEILYNKLLEIMKDTTIISIGHRSSLEKFHDRIIFAEDNGDTTYRFIELGKDTVPSNA